MKYIFFFISILVFVPSIVFADSGPNYDRQFLGDVADGQKYRLDIYMHDRIYDGSNWVDNIFEDNITDLKFKSAYIDFIFDKTDCSFSLYDTATGNQDIKKFYTDFLIDNIKQPNGCVIDNIIQNPNQINFTIKNLEYDTVYSLNTIRGLEYTHFFSNSRGKDTTFTFKDVCEDCTPQTVDKYLKIGSYFYDQKNEQHGTFKASNQVLNNFEITYEKTLRDKETFVLDPTFSSNNPSDDHQIHDSNGNNNCEAIPSTAGESLGGANGVVGRQATAHTDDCYRVVFEWDISSIPVTATINDSIFTYQVESLGGAGPDFCDFVGFSTAQPSVATPLALWTALSSDTVLVNADAGCDTPATNVSLDLTATGDSYFESQLSAGWAGIGIKRDVEGATDATARYAFICLEEGTCTPDPTLTIEYTTTTTWNPGPPINPATSNLLNAINVTWTPNNATGVIGYTIWNSTTNSTNDWEWDDLNTTGNFTGSVGYYYDSGSLWGCKDMYYKISAFALNNGTNSTVTQGTAVGYPNAVEDLVIDNTRFTSADISWGPPNIRCGTVQGYQINYTTPLGDPTTIISNNTGNTNTESEISGLSVNTPYSIRVSVWTQSGNNATGNIANFTTLGSAITFGNVSLSGTNTDTIQMLFEKQSVNSTHTFVNVTYSNTFDLACDLAYELAKSNRTYTGLDKVAINAAFDESSFLFINQTEDIVTIHCWDQNTGYNDKYVLQWSSFPLVDQVNAFRDGTFGTDGTLGPLDFITVIVIIGSMLGFNRNNESVGVIFSVAFIGFMAFLGVVEWPTLLTGIIAIIVIVTVTSTRKD